MEYSKWFGVKVNFKWPHDGFVLGFSLDHYEETEDLPWESIVFRTLFITIIYDYGYGDDTKEIYNNQ